MANCLPEGLPFPSSTREQSSGVIHALRVEIDALEKKLQESSKVRRLLFTDFNFWQIGLQEMVHGNIKYNVPIILTDRQSCWMLGSPS